MTGTEQAELVRRLRYILHSGFIEVRNLALVEGTGQQIHDLADAMEILPNYMEDPTDDDMEMIRFILQDYRNKYPNSREYVKFLDEYAVPDRY